MAAPRILIVDDEPLNVDYLQQELEGPEFQILTASSGDEALEQVASAAPDLVLLDIMMPGMDGFEVLRLLKASAETRNIPVIVISAASDVTSVVKGIQLGAEDYLPKPFQPTLLRARITSSLENKRLHDLEHMYLQGLEREIDIAREIQQGFLPAELPHLSGWDLASYFRAAREVAGDFYDAFVLPDGRLVCFVGDVCGKGVGAALFMTLFRSLLRAPFTSDLLDAAYGQPALSPGAHLQRVVSFTSKYVADTHAEANMFATVFMAVFEPRDGTLTYVNCGNEAPLLLSGGSLTALGPTGPVIGIIPDARFGVKVIKMQPGDTLVAFTDGIPDATNARNELFGRDRLTAVIGTGRPAPSDVIARLELDLARFVGDSPQFDDITLLAVQRNA